MSHRIPKYRKHASGQARVTLGGDTFYLGTHGTPDSRRRYYRLTRQGRALLELEINRMGTVLRLAGEKRLWPHEAK